MEIGKKTLLMNHEEAYTRHIITIDDDFNVPDSKPDIVGRIKEKGQIVIEKLRPLEGRIELSAQLKYRLLYTAEGGCDSICGSIPVLENIPAEGLNGQTLLKCQANLVDLKISVVNSRKINIKAGIAVVYTPVTTCEREAVNSCQLERVLEQKKSIQMLQLVSNRRDLFRIRESTHLPKDRVNVGRLLWQELNLKNIEYRPMAGEVGIKGEIGVFCIYAGENDATELNYFDCVLPFDGSLKLSGCNEETLLDIDYSVSEESLIVRPDENGEMRIADGEMVLDMDIFAYKNSEEEVLSDVYSPAYSLMPHYITEKYQSFVMKDSVRLRLEERKRLADMGIASILSATGVVNVEEPESASDGVYIEGVVVADVLYVRADPENSLGCMQVELPFHEKTSLAALNSDMQCNIKTGPAHITTYLTGTGEIDMKCNAIVEIAVTETKEASLMDSVEVDKPDYAYIKSLPGIVGYVTKEGDTLWNIAKKYCTTIDDIRQVNSQVGDEPAVGTKLIIIK